MVRALALCPGGVEVIQLPAPDAPGPGEALVRTRFVGVCGTDRELAAAGEPPAPAGDDFLVLGHELLGEVVAAGAGVDSIAPGDTVTARVRGPCPGCPSCETGRSDLCTSGHFAEHGIRGLHGFARDQLTLPADVLVRLEPSSGPVGVLVEPLSVAEKAVEAAASAAAGVTRGGPRRSALVIGCGAIGLLVVALLTRRGYEVVVLDRRPADHPAAAIARRLGATYDEVSAAEPLGALERRFDVVFEASGDGAVALGSMQLLHPCGVLVQIGVALGRREEAVDVSAFVRLLVERQLRVVGVASASPAHFDAAVDDLPALLATPGFGQIISDVHDLAEFEQAIHPRPRAVKSVLAFG